MDCKGGKKELESIVGDLDRLINKSGVNRGEYEKRVEKLIAHLKDQHKVYQAFHFTYTYSAIYTLFGATFMVLAPEHQLVDKITAAEQKQAVDKYKEYASTKSELDRKSNIDKTGEFTGAYAVHPFSKALIPIWISDYVLVDYGTGAIMAVPAHDTRDFEFAKTFDIPVVCSNSAMFWHAMHLSGKTAVCPGYGRLLNQ